MSKKILVITPRFPYPEAGACEQDRADGLRQLKRLGYDVKVIGKFFDFQDKEKIVNLWNEEGVDVIPVEYVMNKISKAGKIKMILNHPYCLDGSALEYTEPNINNLLIKELEEFKPDYVWFDYTYLWPLYKHVQKRNIPIITRSINFEARHFLEEDGRSLLNYLKYIPKYITEVITAKKSDILFSITPLEKMIYEKVGAKLVKNLPLRALANKIAMHTPRDIEKLNVFFSGSTYNVSHNRRALEFIIKDLAPKCYKKYGDKFTFRITGSKFPEDLKGYIIDNVVYEGFVEDMDSFLQNMDIAVVPSIYGAGMQQKIFEPLTRGFPTITHERGLADYDFVPKEDVLVGVTVDDFIDNLEKLLSFDLRKRISDNCKIKGKQQFSQNVLDGIIEKSINSQRFSYVIPRSSQE
ncbi:MAG: glycosyltransferase [bacterium]|nr:glycosyltransferase [bacterium]